MPVGITMRTIMSADLAKYGIKNAALFDGTTGYLSRIFITPTNQNIFTLSMWVERSKLNKLSGLFAPITTNQDVLYWNGTADTLKLILSGVTAVESVGKHRDPTAFEHLVYSQNVTTTTLYVNGSQVGIGTGTVNTVNSVIQHTLGSYNGAANFFTGYMANIVFTDGQALTPSSFGETDTATGNWIAKKYAGTYGANGFHLDFSNSTALGTDSSGNGNNWTVTGGVTQVTSTPTDRIPTVNPLDAVNGSSTKFVLSNGNRSWYYSSTTEIAQRATFGFPAGQGKWYWEQVVDSTFVRARIGIVPTVGYNSSTLSAMVDDYSGFLDEIGAFAYHSGTYTKVNSISLYVANGDIVQCAFDAIAGNIWFGLNNVWYGATTTEINANPSTGNQPTLSGVNVLKDYCPYFFDYDSRTKGTVKFNSTEWTYTPPTGFKALTTNNLPAVTATKKNVNDHFKTVLYTGTGATQSITGVGFQPSMIWGKSRNLANSHVIQDVSRGLTKQISSNQTAAEQTQTDVVTSVDVDGFTVGASLGFDMNQSGSNLVAYCFNLPNTKTSGWLGSLTITPSKEIYNTDLGMSIVTYTGNGVAGATIPHSLGKKPGVVIVKRLDVVSDFDLYHSRVGYGSRLALNTTAAKVNISDIGVTPIAISSTMGTNTGSTPTAIIDNNVGTLWDSYDQSNWLNKTITFTFSSSIAPTRILMAVGNASSWGSTSWKVERSSDNINWTTVVGSVNLNFTESLTFTESDVFVNNTAATYLRLTCLVSRLGSVCDILECHFSTNTLDSQLIPLRTSYNVNGGIYVAYIFAESDFIKIGSYTGNGSADGPFVNEMVSPVWDINKRVDTTGGWVMIDDKRSPYNVRDDFIYADSSVAEGLNNSNVARDYTAVGVKYRTIGASTNASGGTYIYMMIGQPTGGSNVAEATAR